MQDEAITPRCEGWGGAQSGWESTLGTGAASSGRKFMGEVCKVGGNIVP